MALGWLAAAALWVLAPVGAITAGGCSPALLQKIDRFFFEYDEGPPEVAVRREISTTRPVESAPAPPAETVPTTQAGDEYISQHEPYVTRRCRTCHTEDNPRIDPAAYAQACAECHADIFAYHRFTHAPLAVGDCESCHVAHRSRFAGLLTDSQQKVCGQCHEAGKTLVCTDPQAASRHCTECHDPHFADNARLLKPDAPLLQQGESRRPAGSVPVYPLVRLAAGCVWAAALGVPPDAPVPSPLDYVTKACNDAACHGDLEAAAFLHAPIVQAVGCDQCHTLTDQNEHLFGPLPPQPDICFDCHTLTHTRPIVHAPVANWQCLDCHDPHSSEQRFLLRDPAAEAPRFASGAAGVQELQAILSFQPVGELCMSCHGGGLSLAGAIHRPVREQGCLRCHRGHDGDDHGLLKEPLTTGCRDCHEDKIDEYASFSYVHRPVADGRCTGCHAAHASEYAGLILAAYPEENYADYVNACYELCWRCHEPALAELENTATATRFRNGEKNLHYLHVNRARNGRTCRVCHDTHAGDGEALVRRQIALGTWETPQTFERTATGGRCTGTCHAAKRYDRRQPADLDAPVRLRADLAGALLPTWTRSAAPPPD